MRAPTVSGPAPDILRLTLKPGNRTPTEALKLFYAPTPAGRAAGIASLHRILQRTDRDPAVAPAAIKAHAQATLAFLTGKHAAYPQLRRLRKPTLIGAGRYDAILAANNDRIVAQLILGDDSSSTPTPPTPSCSSTPPTSATASTTSSQADLVPRSVGSLHCTNGGFDLHLPDRHASHYDVTLPTYTRSGVAKALAAARGASMVSCDKANGVDGAWDCELAFVRAPSACSRLQAQVFTRPSAVALAAAGPRLAADDACDLTLVEADRVYETHSREFYDVRKRDLLGTVNPQHAVTGKVEKPKRRFWFLRW